MLTRPSKPFDAWLARPFPGPDAGFFAVLHPGEQNAQDEDQVGPKKRFRMTASGKVKAGAAGKRHGMIKRSNDFIRDARGTMILSEADAKIVKIYMPYNR